MRKTKLRLTLGALMVIFLGVSHSLASGLEYINDDQLNFCSRKTCSVECSDGFYACCSKGLGGNPECICFSNKQIFHCPDGGGPGNTQCEIPCEDPQDDILYTE